jgi:hypothetical protein
MPIRLESLTSSCAAGLSGMLGYRLTSVSIGSNDSAHARRTVACFRGPQRLRKTAKPTTSRIRARNTPSRIRTTRPTNLIWPVSPGEASTTTRRGSA